MTNRFLCRPNFAEPVSLVATMAITLASPLQAQEPFLIGGGAPVSSEKSEAMRGVCSDGKFARLYANYMMGYRVFDTGAVDPEGTEKANALASEITSRAELTDWSFKGWQGNELGGTCAMHFAMKLAPEHAAHFNNNPLWGGDVAFRLANENGQWKVQSYEDSGAKVGAAGWLAVWRAARDRMPGGAPRLPTPLSEAEQEVKVKYARACASHWEVTDDLFPAYNSWLDVVGPILNNLKIKGDGVLENGRLISSSDSEIICRYDVGTGTTGGAVNRSIHDIDLRFTMNGGLPKWEVASFPYAPAEQFAKDQSERLVNSIYVGDQTLQEWSAARKAKPAEAAPRNVVDAMAQQQKQYVRSAEAELRKQGIDVDAFKRAEAEETRKYAPACRKRGGTWGKPLDKHGNPGRLGCYFPTGER